jgi:hypothetical protein
MGFIGKIAKIIGLLFLGFIALIVVVAVVGGGSKSNSASNTQQNTTAASAPAQAAAAPQQPEKSDKPAPTPVVLPTVGGEAQSGGWKIGLQKMDTASQLGQTKYTKGTAAQGEFVVLTVSATNLQKQTSTLNSWDFVLKTADGIAYKTSTEGSTALITDDNSAKPLYLTEEVQPGLTKTFRVVFDVNPSVNGYTLEAAGNKFAVNLA